jgi:hypothetical protein
MIINFEEQEIYIFIFVLTRYPESGSKKRFHTLGVRAIDSPHQITRGSFLDKKNLSLKFMKKSRNFHFFGDTLDNHFSGDTLDNLVTPWTILEDVYASDDESLSDDTFGDDHVDNVSF